MFVGHLALGLAARRVDRRASLAWFVAAVTLVDLIWPVLMLAGVEHARPDPGNTAFTPLAFDSYPWTHSLLMGVVWGAAFGALARLGGLARSTASILGALVVSHWVLDLVTHRPDLPIWPWASGLYGFGLWHSVGATFLVEGVLWIAGIGIFLGARRLRGWKGALAFWSFVIVSTLIWATGPFSPPPPDSRALAVFALAGWIVIPWSWWIDSTSIPR